MMANRVRPRVLAALGFLEAIRVAFDVEDFSAVDQTVDWGYGTSGGQAAPVDSSP
jgi:hypothetical protein